MQHGAKARPSSVRRSWTRGRSTRGHAGRAYDDVTVPGDSPPKRVARRIRALMPIRTLVVDDEATGARSGCASCCRRARWSTSSATPKTACRRSNASASWRRIWCSSTSRCPAAAGSKWRHRSGRPRPAIIFCTAFDQYAVDAFELHAVDYLLKPVNRARLRAALERVASCVKSSASTNSIASRAATAVSPARFLARKAARFRVVPRQRSLPSPSTRA